MNRKLELLRTVATVLEIALVGFKIRADIRRHGAHTEHNQKCECYSRCFSCLVGR